MNTIETKLLINGVELCIGDKVVVNKNIFEETRCESVFRGYEVEYGYIKLWFSKNNFSSKVNDDYDVITHLIWSNDMNNDIDDMNLEIIK